MFSKNEETNRENRSEMYMADALNFTFFYQQYLILLY